MVYYFALSEAENDFAGLAAVVSGTFEIQAVELELVVLQCSELDKAESVAAAPRNVGLHAVESRSGALGTATIWCALRQVGGV